MFAKPVSARTTIKLGVAATLLIVAGASVIGLALAGTAGGKVALSVQNLAGLALGLVLAGAGLESLRRRHFWFSVLVPAVYAFLNLGYAAVSGESAGLVTAGMFVTAVVLVGSSRASFRA